MQTTTAVENDSILARLKARTAHQHQQTEDEVDLLSDDFSIDDYLALLIKFYSFYRGFENRLAKARQGNPVDFDYSERLNTPKLEADLRSLGMTENEIEEINPCDNLPRLDSKERIFGALYVVEGSTLGGQIIARHLKQKFGLDETNGIAFFSGYGKETGKMWKQFGAAVTEFAETSSEQEEIIAAANETFEKIGQCLAD